MFQITNVTLSLSTHILESRSTRVYNISYAVYYRSLTRLQSLQREVSCYLRRLKISLKLVSS